MANISKKTAYDIKEASNQSLSAGARKHYAENAQAGFKSDSGYGSFMSQHSHSSSPILQGEKSQEDVMKSRDKNVEHHQSIYDTFHRKAQTFTPTSQNQVNVLNKKYEDLSKNLNLRIKSRNKSADSINKVNASARLKSEQVFKDLMK
tara:strand:+ start:1043 stop:1486 length:444 start_codon:yes stop_codon:yes gene_type:complete